MSRYSGLWAYAAALGGAALFGLLLSFTPIGGQLDYWTYDLLLRLFPPPARQSSAVILAIDERTLAASGGLMNLRRPVGEALQILERYEPASIAIDIVLSERRDDAENEALARAIATEPPTVLAANLRADGQGWENPVEPFSSAAAALGHVHAEPDADGVCRRILLAKAAGRERRWALGLEAFRLARDATDILQTEDGLQVGDAFIPAPYRRDQELLLRYANPASPIERLSLQTVLEDPSAAEAVRGRAVFVGVLVLGGLDRYLMTPYSFGEPMAGVEINASVYETLARGEFLRPVAPSTALAAALLLAGAFALLFRRLSGWRAVAAGAGLLALAQTLPALLFQQDLVFPAAQTTFVAWACFLTGASYHYLVVRRQLEVSEAQTNRYQKAVHYVTHEMRTPLTAIQGSSELISRFSLPEDKQRQIGELIHKESQRLARMVEIFLSVERLSAGQLELRREAVSVSDVLEECVRRVRPLADRKRIAVSCEAPPHLRVDGDHELLEYACYNLISNAVKYSPAETAIDVRAWSSPDRILIAVRDQGYGMDSSELRKIFQRFYRARTAQQSGENGSGLGLAIVEEIVIQHQGSISVESQPGEGSCFTVSLPRGVLELEPKAARHA
ncbi:MAG: CHASE2 domain-containing protein [Acidobacteria bacterium]|nr:CHASE2 domain-containing protein [Acidobacteriota bacterium]